LVRLGPLEQILRGEGAAATGARRVRIKLAAPGFALADWLAARPGVTNVGADVRGPAGAAPGAPSLPATAAAPASATSSSAVFELAGSEADLAELVRALVGAGASVCGVEEITESLEQLFFRISSGEVM
ncbi:MAG: hypothetical protein ACRD6I_17920, partial [Candidatus Acidiferrales bacterium]